jgi:hypothetical protein
MASTGRKNDAGNYRLEQHQNKQFVDQRTFEWFGKPVQAMFPGDGLMMGPMSRDSLSKNAIDIDTFLKGIGSTNLVNPKAPTEANIYKLKSVNLYDKPIVFLSNPPTHKDNSQRLRFM